MRGRHLSVYLRHCDPALVLCAAVIERAVQDAKSEYIERWQRLTPAEREDARAFIHSDDVMAWLEPLTPRGIDAHEIARLLREDVPEPLEPRCAGVPEQCEMELAS